MGARARRLISLWGAVLGATALLLGLTSTSALASRELHLYEGLSFGSFTNVVSVATDRSGDVYVFDSGTGKILKYSPAGVALEFAPSVPAIEGLGSPAGGEAQIAVDDSSGANAGDIYVAYGAAVQIFSPAGAPLGELTSGVQTVNPAAPWAEACGVAVDGAGNVYVDLFEPGVASYISKYAPSGSPAANSDYAGSLWGGQGEFLHGSCNIGVDSAGANIYAANHESAQPVRQLSGAQFNTTGTLASVATLNESATGSTLAVSSATGEIYVDMGGSIQLYNAAGQAAGTLEASEPFGGSFGVASVPNGPLYVSDNADARVDVFAYLQLPEVVTDAASAVTTTSATIAGTVNPRGLETTYQFEYGIGPSYGSVAPAAPVEAGSGNSARSFSVPLTGLTPLTTYHYRIVATNINGTEVGADAKFTTPGPAATIGGASAINAAAESFSGIANVRGLTGTYHFSILSTNSTYLSSTPETALPASSADVPVAASIEGLPAGGSYSVTLTVTAGGVSVTSEPIAFETAPVAPFVAPPRVALNITPPGSAPSTVAPPPVVAPTEPTPAPTKPKPLTKAQKLAAALKLCHAKSNKKKRHSCEATARKRYGAKAKKK